MTLCINIFDLHVKHESGMSILSMQPSTVTVQSKALEEHIPEKLKEEDNIHQYFLEVARDDGEVDWVELKSILDYHMQTELGFEGFSKDICRSMVAMLDEDHSGRLGYSEFRKLWASLQDWKNVWILYDIDKSGTFSGFELRTALNSAGYSVNIRILNILMHRYGNKKGEIQFEDFMMCAIKLKTMIDIFKEKDVIECNTACFSMEDWLECTLYS